MKKDKPPKSTRAERALTLVGIIARMTTSAEMKANDGDWMCADDAIETLSNLIAEARRIQEEA